ncbi:hypothetical protein ACFVAG_16980 [Streptomyces sp. NPDC057644]|uniref:hypothetical protein n=1 Tax=Streptomyces sp. NPDC057644 TaxID=3346191 RepID=UPI003684CE5C
MNQCTAVALLPPPEHVLALSIPGRHRPEAGHVLCELGEDHDETHATMLWDEGGRPGSAVWVRWGAGDARLLPLPWCPARDPRDADDACGLFVGHPSGHSWAVTDPTDEAITRDLARRHPHLFR